MLVHGFILVLLFNHGAGASKFLRNAGNLSEDYRRYCRFEVLTAVVM
jgi:hypothetical protein